ERGELRAPDEAHLHLDDGDQGPLGADGQPVEPEWLRLHELVEVVARDAPHELRVPGADLVGMLRDETTHLAVDLSLQTVRSALRLELGRSEVPEHDLRAVGEEALEL